MFRSARRPIVIPQAEHALLAGAMAAVWDAERFPLPPGVDLARFAEGVREHDRGYGELDDDEIGEVANERWLEIQRLGFEPVGDDALVDAVVALHVRRLVSYGGTPADEETGAEMDRRLPELISAAGLTRAGATQLDRITHLCDAIAFDFCLEEPASGRVAVVERDEMPHPIGFQLDGMGSILLSPWPLTVEPLEGTITGYEADGYPEALRAVAVAYGVSV